MARKTNTTPKYLTAPCACGYVSPGDHSWDSCAPALTYPVGQTLRDIHEASLKGA